MKTRSAILIFILPLLSCTGYKQIALTNLSYHDLIGNYSIITKNELSGKQYVVYHHDTISVFKKNVKTFGYRNIKTKEILIFQFKETDYYTTIQCDSLWRVQQLSYYMGEVY